MTLTIDIQIASTWPRGLKKPIEEIARASFGAGCKTKLKSPVGVCIRLAEDAEVKSLNHDFRGKPKSTNVLSFPGMEWRGGKRVRPDAENWLGDIILARGVVLKEAKSQKKAVKQHVLHLVAHGVLHLLGYDHMNESDADTMEKLERKILRSFGIDDPYVIQD